MPKSKKNEVREKENPYFKTNDMAGLHGCSRSHVPNLVEQGVIPQPLIIGGVKVWPKKLIKALNKQREERYFESLRAQGFEIPDNLGSL